MHFTRRDSSLSICRQVGVLSPSHALDSVSKSITLVHNDHSKYPGTIVIHICRFDKPEMVVYRQKATAMFVSMSGMGIQVPYADMTFQRMSMFSHEYAPLSTSSDVDDFKVLLKSVRESGWEVVKYHSCGDTRCGVAITCPATVRTTVDHSAFSFTFRKRVWSTDHQTKRSRQGVVWSLGAMGCSGPGASIESFVGTFDINVGFMSLGESSLFILRNSDASSDAEYEKRMDTLLD